MFNRMSSVVVATCTPGTQTGLMVGALRKDTRVSRNTLTNGVFTFDTSTITAHNTDAPVPAFRMDPPARKDWTTKTWTEEVEDEDEVVDEAEDKVDEEVEEEEEEEEKEDTAGSPVGNADTRRHETNVLKFQPHADFSTGLFSMVKEM